MNVINKIVKNSGERMKFMPDDKFLELMYRAYFGKKLDINNPCTFNEKLQWLKIHNRTSLMCTVVDKYEVKRYIARLLGDGYIIPTYGVWENFDDIDFSKLPEQFVLKCTHGGDLCVICTDRESFKPSVARELLNKSLEKNYYWLFREWPYKYAWPRIMAEAYSADMYTAPEIHFYCFNGLTYCMLLYVPDGNGGGLRFFFDRQGRALPVENSEMKAPDKIKMPGLRAALEMFNIADWLSKGCPFVRIQMYVVAGKVYFGKFSFYPYGGFDTGLNSEVDKYWGELVNLKLVSAASILKDNEMRNAENI